MKKPRQIRTIDCDYVRKEFAAAYLLREGSEAAFIETNTSRAVPRLLQALETEGLSPSDVRYVIITHVHLDHAGGVGTLMRACPQATLLAHPRAAAHMIDPSKLVSSARKVYGDAVFEQLYGEIPPVESSRVRAMEDGEEIDFGSGRLRFLHTRGHANHHFCIVDPDSSAIFTGDTFGLRYPALQRKGLLVIPSTSPTDFHPQEAQASLRKVLASGATRAFLTHYGELTEMREAASQLSEQIEFSASVMEQAIRSGDTDGGIEAACQKKIERYYRERLLKSGLDPASDDWELLKLDLELNASGIAYAARKQRQALAGDQKA